MPPRPGSPLKQDRTIPILQGWPGYKQISKRLITQSYEVEWNELEGEINSLGISIVLDAVYDYRLSYNIDFDNDTDSESLIRNWAETALVLSS